MNQQKTDNAEVCQRFANLSNRDLSSQDLRGYDFTGATLKGAKLIEANLWSYPESLRLAANNFDTGETSIFAKGIIDEQEIKTILYYFRLTGCSKPPLNQILFPVKHAHQQK